MVKMRGIIVIPVRFQINLYNFATFDYYVLKCIIDLGCDMTVQNCRFFDCCYVNTLIFHCSLIESISLVYFQINNK